MLVPVGAKYEDLQQTGRKAGDREEIKVDIKEKDKQTETFSQSPKAEAASFRKIHKRIGQ